MENSKNKPGKIIFPSLRVIILLAFFGTIAASSCRPGQSKETLQKMDTLQNFVNQAGEILIIDENIIKSRNDSIKIWSAYMRTEYTGVIDLELNAMLSKMKGIGKNYKAFVENYPPLKHEHEEHIKRIANLKKDVLEGRLSDDDFDKIYINEKQVLGQHLEKVKEIARSIYLIENDYKRSSRYIDEFIKKDMEKTKK
jgi:hypothetical protein